MTTSKSKAKLRKLIRIKKVYDIYKNMMKKLNVERSRRVWCRAWLLRRSTVQLGASHFLDQELRLEDPACFKNFVRMDKDQFDKLYDIVKSKISKADTVMRKCIPSKHRLILTLRYLATGESYTSLSYTMRISLSAISQIIPNVCVAIYEGLKEMYLKVPCSAKEWKDVSRAFKELWNIPNTLGALDGKHIVFRAPKCAGSHYYNYKGNHSIVLLAIADANYNFLYINIGTNEKVSDGGVFNDSDLAYALKNNALNIPADEPLPTMNVPVPYVFLADAAFPLQKHIMKPFPFKNMTKEERIFNYRLSRGRRVIENTFGILANRFRILLAPIPLYRDKVVIITQACCALHNYLNNNSMNTSIVDDNNLQLHSISLTSGRANTQVLHVRDIFKEYFNNVDVLEWQNNMA